MTADDCMVEPEDAVQQDTVVRVLPHMFRKLEPLLSNVSPNLRRTASTIGYARPQ